jgi:phosphopantothenoylcysteine synthetase/decarboxylase
MAAGFPVKATFVDGDVYSASDVNDLAGTVNLIKPTAKGDVFAGSAANTYTKLAVGADATVLTADSTTATGLKWAAAGSTSGPAFRVTRTATQSISTATWTKVQFNSETFDTDNCFDATTNYRFTPTKAGYYQLGGFITNVSAGQAAKESLSAIYINGAAAGNFGIGQTNSWTAITHPLSQLYYFNGSTTYAELYTYIDATTAQVGAASLFTGVWIRS